MQDMISVGITACIFLNKFNVITLSQIITNCGDGGAGFGIYHKFFATGTPSGLIRPRLVDNKGSR